MVLVLRLPVAEGAVWVWGRRLLLVVAGTAAAWFLLLMVSGQAHAASPPALACLASSAPDGNSQATSSEDPVAIPPVPAGCASPPTSEQLSPASVATGAVTGTAGPAATGTALDHVPPLSALDQLTGGDVAGPAGSVSEAGNHVPAFVAPLIAAVTPEATGEAARTAPGGLPTGTPPDTVAARSARSVPVSRTSSDGAGVLVAEGKQAHSGAVPRPGGRTASESLAGARPAASRGADGAAPAATSITASRSAPVSSGVRPSTGSASPSDVGRAPLWPPAPSGPCVDMLATTASGSGGSHRFDALGVLGSQHGSILPAGSTGVPSGSHGDAVGRQARPEPRPD
jgi:hypothetical protein